MPDDFLGRPTWEPGGFVSTEDELAQHAAYAGSIRMAAMNYAYNVPFGSNADRGDEIYGGDSFQYIPTEIEVGAALAMRNMASAGELPVHTNDPGVQQLLQSIYQNTARFWQDIRNASGTGW